MQPPKQIVVLFEGFGEPEARIENQPTHAAATQLLGTEPEIGNDLLHHIAVRGHPLHRRRSTPHVHSDIGSVVLGDHIDDGRIHLSGRDVIDDHRAECFEHPPGYLGTERIDRNGQCGSDPPHGGHPRFHTTPLLLGRHLGGSGPGGVASDVEQIATGIGRFADTPFDSLGIRCAAAGEKGVGRDIDDRHNARRGQIRQNVFGFHRVTIYPGGQPRIRAPRDLY